MEGDTSQSSVDKHKERMQKLKNLHLKRTAGKYISIIYNYSYDKNN